MFPLISKRSRTPEAQTFFNESQSSAWPGMVAGLVAVTSVASTIAMLFTV
jgi:hypothetical protein